MTHRPRATAVSLLFMCIAAAAARAAEDHTAMLQYFEAQWQTMAYRMPDVFAAGYDAAWLPPPQKGAAGASSIGYDLFDRFDLGSDAAPTRYGTESDFRLAVSEFHKAGCRVYVDWLMNHNASNDNSTPNFLTQGGYPGFALALSGSPYTDPYGDFHTPGTQSENPGGANFNLWQGRLLGLIDIAQEKDYQLIRHPITLGDPNNVPAGTVYNKPNAANRKFYPDRNLAGTPVSNPGTSRNPGTTNYTFYPYNLADPAQGDPITENATGLLMRSTQYYLDVLKVDGFRLDAAKHIPTWFWDTYWDAVCHLRYRAFDGTLQTPFSFVEAVGGGGIDPYDYTRKDAFANRDGLDLDEAGKLRDIVTNPGGNGWDTVLNASLDNRDFGLNNGSLGVHHVSSHDNAISGNQLTSSTYKDTFSFACMLLRTGPGVVYYNAQQFGANVNNFPRRDGRDDALGIGDASITQLVRLRRQLVRGRFDVLNFSDCVNSSLSNILVMQHSHDLGGGFAGNCNTNYSNLAGNCVVGVSKLQTNGQDGTDARSVRVAFPAGTRLHELTGAWTDPVTHINPVTNPAGIASGAIAETLTVDAGNRILIKTPRNKNSAGTYHGRGYVVYAPALPSGTLTVTNVASTLAADSSGVPAYKRRITPVDVITADTFEIRLSTTQTDALDPNTDDQAKFRIDAGFFDANSNGSIDDLNSNSPSYGYESFLTQSDSLFANPGNPFGNYRQVINAAALGEGFHYVSVLAFRHRSDGGDPIFTEFRKVIYVDRLPPQVTLTNPSHTCNNDVTSLPLVITAKAADLTVDRVHIFVDQPEGTNLQNLANFNVGRAARSLDTFTLTVSALISGNHRIDVLAYESTTNRVQQQTFTGVQSTGGAGSGPGDINGDNLRDGNDVAAFMFYVFSASPLFSPAADINCDGRIDASDVPGFVALLLNN